MLRLTGPLGAPAQNMWHFPTIMMVAAGVGATPFSAMLRSANVRMSQRTRMVEAMIRMRREERREGAGSASDEKQMRGANGGCRDHVGGEQTADKSLASTAESSLLKLVQDTTRCPRRLYFYWIARSEQDFEWLYPVFSEAVNGPAKDLVQINLITTGFQLKKGGRGDLGDNFREWYGRPNWGQFFKEVKAENEGQQIGVFLCGTPAIGKSLAEQSRKFSDGEHGGTKFSYYAENF